jgi:hypothetical protein
MTTIRFQLGRKPGRPDQPAEVSTAARTLAMAHFVDREIRAGRWKTCREAGRALGIGESRVQKVLMLRFLPAGVQAEVLAANSAWSERALRRAASLSQWPTPVREES